MTENVIGKTDNATNTVKIFFLQHPLRIDSFREVVSSAANKRFSGEVDKKL